MDTILVDGVSFYLPESISDVQQLVTQARQSGSEIRVRGAAHSVPGAIFPDNPPGKPGIFVILSKMRKVTIDGAAKLVTVEAGCNLNVDPYDPTGISFNPENNLLPQLDKAGLAIPDLGGITHQTVGGFLSTGSSGGSTQFGFDDCLRSITFIPADSDNPQPVTLQYSDDPDNPFFAAGISMGLFGIIVSASFTLVERFNIIGTQVTTDTDACAIDLFGKGKNNKPSFKDYLEQTQYARLMWWPQRTDTNKTTRMVVWQARQMQPSEKFQRNPYRELGYFPKILSCIAGWIYKGIGKWPDWLRPIFYPGVMTGVLNIFQPKNTVNFQDYWYSGLPMDNDVDDRSFPVLFTELWIDIDQTEAVMNTLKQVFEKYYEGSPGAAGDFSTELYAAKESRFWMSPSYKGHKFRVDVFWFGKNPGSPADDYYPIFWKALKDYNFRPHWGKYIPGNTADQPAWQQYLQQQYPKWNAFMALREKYDPQQVFVNDYWRQKLNISNVS